MTQQVYLFKYIPLTEFERHPHGTEEAIVFRSTRNSFGHFEPDLETMAMWFFEKNFEPNLEPITLPKSITSKKDGCRYDPLPREVLDRFREIYATVIQEKKYYRKYRTRFKNQ